LGKKSFSFTNSAPIKLRFNEVSGTVGVSYKF
jgi:hypothetical protein